jgi:uncharacterized paraquat-inducible protein A
MLMIKRLFNDKKRKIDNNNKMQIKISILKRMLKPGKQSSMVWIGIVLISSLVLSMFLPTPIAIGIFILWALFVYLSWVLRRFIGGKQKSLRNTSNTYSSYNYIENAGLNYYCMMCGKSHNDKSCPVCGSKIKKASF